ncbi:MAG: MFS transporter [Chloroflexi bacterium]|nr:MAG: MFS transporter [Chloroflexota bacterium]
MIKELRGLRVRDDLKRWIALVVVCFGQLMIVLDATIVNVALPPIQHDLGFSQADLTWVVNAYGISYGGFVLLAGRVGDLVGRKPVFLAGVILFTIASALAGLAPVPALLVAARFAQGLGGALSAGVIIAMIVTGFKEPRERAQAMSVFAFTIAGGGSLGLLAGGVLTQFASWHWVFFINLPIGLVTLLAGMALIERDPGAGLRQGVDVAGSILVTAAVMLGVYTIVTADASGWTSARTLWLGAASALLLAGFFGLQARLANPILPLGILANRSLVGASVARGLLATGMFTNFFLGALYLQRVRGFSALGIGLAFLPFTLALGAASLGITVRLVGRFGSRRVLIVGLLCITAALLSQSSIAPATAYFPRLLMTYALFGLGAGMSLMPLTLLAMAEVPAAHVGLATGINNASMQVSAAFGLAALGSVAAGHGFQLAFVLAAGLVTCALAVVLVVLRPARRPAPASTATEDSELQLAA